MSFTGDVQVIKYFTQGQCYALAYELHKLTEWSIVLISDLPVDNLDYMGHIFVMDSNAYAIDIKGKRTLDDMKADWSFCPYIHRFFDVKEFEEEMLEWKVKIPFNKDKKAKWWARYIVDMLS